MSIKEKVAYHYMKKGNRSPAICTAIASFFDEEASLLGDSLKSVAKKFPQRPKDIADYNTTMYLPIECARRLIREKLPLYFAALKERRDILNVKAPQMLKSYYMVEEVKELILELKREADAYEALLNGSIDNLQEFANFNARIIKSIEDKVNSRPSPVPDDKDVRDLSFRNHAYREALGINPGLLGYDLRLMAGLSEIVAKENARRLRAYHAFYKDHLQERERIVVFAEPLGAEAMNSRKYYEEILPSIVKNQSVESYSALKNAVDNHFLKRLSSILS